MDEGSELVMARFDVAEAPDIFGVFGAFWECSVFKVVQLGDKEGFFIEKRGAVAVGFENAFFIGALVIDAGS